MEFTDRQKEAIKLTGGSKHVMLYGGSRSGKTFIHIRDLVLRALKAPGSRHIILRYRFNHVKASIIHDTFPKVMSLCFPSIKWKLDRTDYFVRFENESEVWFGGLDDKERTEKILGNEYSTIYLNECSEISFGSLELVTTRLAQKVKQVSGEELTLRMFYDCNPPMRSHWTYRLFVEKKHPETKKTLPKPGDYGYLQMNPLDNIENLPKGYIDTLEAMSEARKKRFLHGEFGDDNPNALFSEANFNLNRVDKYPDLQRVIVAVDPSGAGDTKNEKNDATGMMVVGLGVDGKAYVLEDLTIKAGPATWGKVAAEAYFRHNGSCIVAEKNYGGEMVRFTIQAAGDDIPFKFVTATRGKVVRAEPVSALYEKGKICHVGDFNDLEDELLGFSTHGYLGEKSPNRADALVWGITELFPGVVNRQETTKLNPESLFSNTFSW